MCRSNNSKQEDGFQIIKNQRKIGILDSKFKQMNNGIGRDTTSNGIKLKFIVKE